MVLFAKVFWGPLLLLIVSTLARTGDEARFLGSKPPAAVAPPRCPTFGEGGRSFFQAATYAEFVRCHNAHYFATHHRPRPIHVLFEASAKTELGAAFGLMKALAAQPEKYQVTYLSPGGTIVRRQPSADVSTHMMVVLAPEERPSEDKDTVLYEFAFPPEKNEELQKAHINVVLKSSGDPSEERWIQTLRSLKNPVDFVVADCYGKPRAVDLLMVQAQVPGASWCGNLGNVGQGLDRADVYAMINEQMKTGAKRGAELMGAELMPMFSAHFLWWGAEGEQPFPNVVLEAPEHDRAVGPTRELLFAKNSHAEYGPQYDYTGPLVENRMKIPISLVSDLPKAKTAVVYQERACENIPEVPQIAAICEKMDEGGAKDRVIRLIYVAFGTQGFRFKKDAYKEIIEAAAAVTDAVVFFVIPPAADWEHAPAYPYNPDTWKTEYYEASVAGEALTLPKNVVLSKFAPQKDIFERFGGPNTVFLTHGGAGSLSQGIANKIALACFGLAFDQPTNCASATEKGLGVNLTGISGRMLLKDKTIEMPGGADGPPPPGSEAFSGDATVTIQASIEQIFDQGTSNKFPTALANASSALTAGAYAAEGPVLGGVFEETIKKQLQLYKDIELFDADLDRLSLVGSDVVPPVESEVEVDSPVLHHC